MSKFENTKDIFKSQQSVYEDNIYKFGHFSNAKLLLQSCGEYNNIGRATRNHRNVIKSRDQSKANSEQLGEESVNPLESQEDPYTQAVDYKKNLEDFPGFNDKSSQIHGQSGPNVNV